MADRYVSGICPHCKFSDARGYQCDGCRKSLDAVELFEPNAIYNWLVRWISILMPLGKALHHSRFEVGNTCALEEFASKVFYVWFDAPIDSCRSLKLCSVIKGWKNGGKTQIKSSCTDGGRGYEGVGRRLAVYKDQI
uniref:Methionyl/Leucyl tRNA synthetase domain-containing protein n=1 Tax=Ditylenchus dipsaci TaxID=166011 RepID=A0A915D437_9BILA